VTIEVDAEILVARPRETVAEFMFDAAREPEWIADIKTSRRLDDGPLRRGSRIERVSRFLGRTYVADIVDADPLRFAIIRIEKPFPTDVRFDLDDSPEGTRVRVQARFEPGRLLSLARPVLARTVKTRLTTDLARLKAQLETS
jgi:hypothetical protein